MKKDATMSKLYLASYLALSLAVCWYAPEAAAVKVEHAKVADTEQKVDLVKAHGTTTPKPTTGSTAPRK